ncbi:MAG TPA: DUF3450 family protein, partial [Fibrobacteraceae bacterium]|nr:DUF3450 family protein [Fibrobacteraceae bacterium]
MKNILLILFFSLSASFVYAAPPSGEQLVKERAQLNSAKADLEEARKKRDMAVAARWKDREIANKERELFNEKYREQKDKIDALMSERARLLEDVRVAREDLSQVKAAGERSRSDFLALALTPDVLDGLTQLQEQGIPFKMTDRIENMNRLKKEIDLYRDDPMRLVRSVFSVLEYELIFSREVELDTGDLIFDNSVKRGQRLRLGGLFAMQKSDSDSSVALLLPVAGEKGSSFSWQTNLIPGVQTSIYSAFASVNDKEEFLIPVDPLLSTTLSSELASQNEKTFKENAIQFFKDGGILMYPIFALLILSILLIIERFIVISFKSYSKGTHDVLKALESNSIDEARRLSVKVKGSIGSILRRGLEKDYENREAAEKAIEEVFAAETPSIEKGLSSISVMASTAPLLGLLGTVMGMIELFEVITMHGTSDPKLLAGGISIALITTQAGLMV